jgi:cysteine desulfurase
MAKWTDQLAAAASAIPGVVLRGAGAGTASRLPNTLAFTVDGSDSIALMAVLDMDGICASSGSACSAGSLEPSHVMLAMGASPAQANALVRFSLGRDTTAEEVDRVCGELPRLLEQVRR